MINGEVKISVFEKLQEGLETLPSQQRQVCQFLLHKYREAAFLTVKAIAEQTGVGPATVMRTISNLGYPSFVDFQSQLHEIMISTNPSSVWWRLEQSISMDNNEEGFFEKVAKENIRAISDSISKMNVANFEKCVDILCSAHDIYVLGMRTSSAVASAFFAMTHQLLPNVKLPGCMGSEMMYEYIIDMTEDDVLLALSVGGPHYAVRTFDAVQYVHSRAIPVVLITDNLANRSVPYATEVLCTSPTTSHYSMVPVMTILDSLLVAIGNRKKDNVLDRLHSLEKLLIEKNINN